MTSFSGPRAVDVFGMLALASGLSLYAKSGIRPSRMATPKAMMAAASRYTGLQFKPRDYLGAAAALREEAARLANNLPAGNEIKLSAEGKII